MRLIDADALKTRIDKICEESKMAFQCLDILQIIKITERANALKSALFVEIDQEPTAAQTWVTCEERLPDMEKTSAEDSLFTEYKSEPVIVQTKRGEIFLAICRKTEYTNNMPKNRIDWYTFGTNGRKMKVMSKVVMWMPKPEPWEGEEK